MLLLFTEDGQLTFTKQNPSREPGADNLEGKREDCKGPSVENKCFSPQASAEWPSSYFMLSVMEATEAPKVQESFPHSELESEPLSFKPVFPYSSGIISFLLRKRGSGDYTRAHLYSDVS